VNSTEIQKFKKVSTAKLKIKAQTIFNAWIRNRDKFKQCISCPGPVEQAGHFYSAGNFNHMRFNEDNCHGQCVKCNYYLSGNLLEYRKRLILKIGIERVEKLDLLAADKSVHKTDRFHLIEIILKYRNPAGRY